MIREIFQLKICCADQHSVISPLILFALLWRFLMKYLFKLKKTQTKMILYNKKKNRKCGQS